jgi:hypothetical protein
MSDLIFDRWYGKFDEWYRDEGPGEADTAEDYLGTVTVDDFDFGADRPDTRQTHTHYCTECCDNWWHDDEMCQDGGPANCPMHDEEAG